jgi:hypothetical protein
MKPIILYFSFTRFLRVLEYMAFEESAGSLDAKQRVSKVLRDY